MAGRPSTKLGERTEMPIVKQARDMGVEPEELVMMALEANGGIQFKAALALGVYPAALMHWRRKYDAKKMTPRINALLGDGNPRWVIRSVQYDWNGTVHVILAVEENGHRWDSAGIVNVAGSTHEEVLVNISEMLRTHDPLEWLDSDATIPLQDKRAEIQRAYQRAKGKTK